MNRVDGTLLLNACSASADRRDGPRFETGGSMRIRWTAAFLVAAALASAPASAQQQAPETQQRESSGGDNDIVWNLLGAIGLLGLFGLQRQSDNDGYTDDPI
jgi:hypothetical protein